MKEFTDGQVRRDQWKKRWLWMDHVLERQQFTRSDEARNEQAEVGAAHAVKRLERERETASGGYTSGSIYPSSIFHWQRSNFQVSVYTMLYHTVASFLKTFRVIMFIMPFLLMFYMLCRGGRKVDLCQNKTSRFAIPFGYQYVCQVIYVMLYVSNQINSSSNSSSSSEERGPSPTEG